MLMSSFFMGCNKEKHRKADIRENSKILKLLERTGIMLKVYRSGKIPKILKLLPLLTNFEDLVWFTRPDRWSSQALLKISKLLIRNLNNIQLKRFLSLIILPRIQECILKSQKFIIYKQLIFNLVISNVKIFFSSIIFPMCSSSKCTKREITFISLIIVKNSFSSKHISWIVQKISKNPNNSAQLIIMRMLISKKYNFSYRLLDILVDFFVNYSHEINNIFFLKCLFAFLQNYSNFLSLEDKNRLLKII